MPGNQLPSTKVLDNNNCKVVLKKYSYKIIIYTFISILDKNVLT